MAKLPVNFSSSTPAAPSDNVNVTWQKDTSGNLSGYVPVAAGSPFALTAKAWAWVNLKPNAFLSNPSNGGVGYSIGCALGIPNGSTVPGYNALSYANRQGQACLIKNTAANYMACVYDGNNFQFIYGLNMNFSAIGFISLNGQSVSSVADARFWAGMGWNNLSSANSTDNMSSGSVDWVGFRYSTTAGDTDYMCTVSNATAGTFMAVSSGVPVDSESHNFAFVCDDAAAQPTITFYIDGNQVGQFTQYPAYSGSTAYTVGENVYYPTNGKSYQCILASTGNAPTDATYWTQTASPLPTIGQPMTYLFGSSYTNSGANPATYIEMGVSVVQFCTDY